MYIMRLMLMKILLLKCKHVTYDEILLVWGHRTSFIEEIVCSKYAGSL